MSTARPLDMIESTAETADDEIQALAAAFARMRRAADDDEIPPAELRIDRLRRLHDALLAWEPRILDALETDFGVRSRDQSLFGELALTTKPLREAMRGVRRWMRPERRSAGFPHNVAGARAEVRWRPLGVVGVIAPWNFPINLALSPLAGVLAAGNRAMIKPSEATPACAELMREMIASVFNADELSVFPGGPHVGAAFAALPFDHLLYTGGEAVAKKIAAAAAENLTPLTLELGGKSPVLIGAKANLALAARRIMYGKMFNAGQICLAPDYVLVPDHQKAALVDALGAALREMFPDDDARDYVAVVNARHAERVRGLAEDAKDKGATVRTLGPTKTSSPTVLPVSLVVDAPETARIMSEEIFGPLLAIVGYRSIDEALAYVRARPHPLALYYFGRDAKETERVLAETRSGGVTVNDVVMHYTIGDLPFGGVGPSGMGAYHGHDGFKRFSHARAVFRQSPFDAGAMLRPPYGPAYRRIVRAFLRHG